MDLQAGEIGRLPWEGAASNFAPFGSFAPD